MEWLDQQRQWTVAAEGLCSLYCAAVVENGVWFVRVQSYTICEQVSAVANRPARRNHAVNRA